MIKTIWMSDPHYTHAGTVLGYDPRVRLRAAIDHVNTHHADAQMCIISGDMVNRGSRADYEGVHSELRALNVPYMPMVGNHDDRQLFREFLPVPDQCMADFVQYSVATSQGIIVCLDTLKSGSDAGAFCQKRRAWLSTVLNDAGETPVFLFMHHPPMALGLPMQDRDNMENGDAFLDLVSSYSCVQYMFIGHVHRPMTGTYNGIPYATMRAILYQAPPPKPAWTWDTFSPAREAPNLGVIHISNSGVNLHYDQFCDWQVGAPS